MIFYFSGTGNSEGIARIAAEYLGEEARNIIGTDPEAYTFRDEEYLGFVFPVYAWAAPEVMLEFAKKLKPKAAYTFAIATFSNVAGMALQHFSDVLPLKSGFGITMPDNYPITERILDTPESSLQKLTEAKQRLEDILERIRKKEECFDVKMGEDARDNSYVKSELFNQHFRKTAPYYAEDTCIGCGLCERLCPAKAIQMQNGRPVWIKEDCYMCMACLNRCPAEAIQYGRYSKGRARYVFKGFAPENYK